MTKGNFRVSKSELFRVQYLVKKHNLRFSFNPYESAGTWWVDIEGNHLDFQAFSNDLYFQERKVNKNYKAPKETFKIRIYKVILHIKFFFSNKLQGSI